MKISSKIIDPRSQTGRILDPVRLRLSLEESGMWMEGMKYHDAFPFSIMGPHA